MPIYVLLSTLTAEGGGSLHADPDRLVAVNDEITAFGCRVIDQYALLGTYDFLIIVEAPDNESVAHLSVDLGSRGTTKITTFPAISISTLVEKLKAPEQIGRTSRAAAAKSAKRGSQRPGAPRPRDQAQTPEPTLARFVD